MAAANDVLKSQRSFQMDGGLQQGAVIAAKMNLALLENSMTHLIRRWA
jgi:hypothetical protein